MYSNLLTETTGRDSSSYQYKMMSGLEVLQRFLTLALHAVAMD